MLRDGQEDHEVFPDVVAAAAAPIVWEGCESKHRCHQQFGDSQSQALIQGKNNKGKRVGAKLERAPPSLTTPEKTAQAISQLPYRRAT